MTCKFAIFGYCGLSRVSMVKCKGEIDDKKECPFWNEFSKVII